MAEEVMESTALARSGGDAPLPVFSGQQMAAAFTAYKALQDALDKAMPDAIMELDGKKFRKKNYWRGVAVAFNLTVETIEERREVSGLFSDGRENFGYVVSKRATAPNGRSVISDGACFAVEKARRFKCPHPEAAGSKRTLHFPHNTCPDFDPEFQWRVQPADATEHNVRGHASTRAFNRAVSDLVGFGEVSAEEVQRSESETGEPHEDAQKPVEKRADGSVKVIEVTTQHGVTKKPGKADKPWTKYTVSFDDGTYGTTFEKALVDDALDAKKNGDLVKATIESDGKYTNLTALVFVRADEPQLPLKDDEPIGTPEKVLTVREVKPAGGGASYYVINTDRRIYITDIAVVAQTADEFRQKGTRAIVSFEVAKSTKGQLFNKIVEFGQASVAQETKA